MLASGLGEEMSCRQVAIGLGLVYATVADHVRRARAAALFSRLPRRTKAATRLGSGPRGAAQKGLKLMLLGHKYREAHPDGYARSQFKGRVLHEKSCLSIKSPARRGFVVQSRHCHLRAAASRPMARGTATGGPPEGGPISGGRVAHARGGTHFKVVPCSSRANKIPLLGHVVDCWVPQPEDAIASMG